MNFLDALVRYEVTLWNAIDAQLRRRGQLSLAEVHALRVVRRYDGSARVQELSDDIGITVGRPASWSIGSNVTAGSSGSPPGQPPIVVGRPHRGRTPGTGSGNAHLPNGPGSSSR